MTTIRYQTQVMQGKALPVAMLGEHPLHVSQIRQIVQRRIIRLGEGQKREMQICRTKGVD